MKRQASGFRRDHKGTVGERNWNRAILGFIAILLYEPHPVKVIARPFLNLHNTTTIIINGLENLHKHSLYTHIIVLFLAKWNSDSGTCDSGSQKCIPLYKLLVLWYDTHFISASFLSKDSYILARETNTHTHTHGLYMKEVPAYYHFHNQLPFFPSKPLDCCIAWLM